MAELLSYATPVNHCWKLRISMGRQNPYDGIHKSSFALMYKNTKVQKQTADAFHNDALALLRPKTIVVVPMVWLVVDFIKELFSEGLDGIIFRMPTDDLRNVVAPAVPNAKEFMEFVYQASSLQPKPVPVLSCHTFFRIADVRPELNKNYVAITYGSDKVQP